MGCRSSTPQSNGIIIVQGNYAIPISNLAAITLNDRILSFHLKKPAMFDDPILTMHLTCTDRISAYNGYISALDAMHSNNIAIIGFLDDEHRIQLPHYVRENYKNGILSINRETINSTNISMINVNGYNLEIYLKYPIMTEDGSQKFSYTLAFANDIQRDSVYKKIIGVIVCNNQLSYYDVFIQTNIKI